MGKLILNGKTYTGNSADGFPPLIYSDDEREVGVWRDGKPLYEKTIDVGYLPSGGAKYVNHNISNLGIVASAYGFGINASGTRLLIPNISTNSTYNVQLSATDTQIALQVGMDRSSFSGYVTLRYTKTTDTAGSGYWATNGDRAVHYSTTEQVIGTWIDGKPLYEKTINVGHNYGSPSSSVRALDYDISALNAKNIINADGFYVGDGSKLPYITQTLQYSCYLFATCSTIQIRRGQSLPYSDDSYVTIQYTKTTD